MGSLEQAVYAIIISFVIGVILCPIVIPMLRKLKFGQNVRDDGPQTHLAKQGTPTMGGVAFLAAFVITSLFFLNGNRDGAAIMLMTLCYGLIGFLDDYIKVVKKRSLGLRAYQKLLLQLIVTGLFCSYIMKSGIGTAIYIPFTDGKMIDLQLIFIPFLFVAVFVGYAVGSAPIVSFHYGARNHAEVHNLYQKSLRLIAVVAVTMTAASMVIIPYVARIFVGYDAQLLALTNRAFRLYALSFLIMGFNVYASSFFTALGDGVTSALISFLRTLVFQLAALLLLPALWGIDGVWLAVTAAELAALAVTVYMFVTKDQKFHYRHG